MFEVCTRDPEDDERGSGRNLITECKDNQNAIKHFILMILPPDRLKNGSKYPFLRWAQAPELWR